MHNIVIYSKFTIQQCRFRFSLLAGNISINELQSDPCSFSQRTELWMCVCVCGTWVDIAFLQLECHKCHSLVSSLVSPMCVYVGAVLSCRGAVWSGCLARLLSIIFSLKARLTHHLPDRQLCSTTAVTFPVDSLSLCPCAVAFTHYKCQFWCNIPEGSPTLVFNNLSDFKGMLTAECQ